MSGNSKYIGKVGEFYTDRGQFPKKRFYEIKSFDYKSMNYILIDNFNEKWYATELDLKTRLKKLDDKVANLLYGTNTALDSTRGAK
jgi:hypothetical protein